MTDVLIVGHGPAGVSAALYAIRAGLETTLIGKDQGALDKAECIENYYGFASPVTGPQLAEAGMEQAKRLGAKIITGEVVGLQWENYFMVDTTESSYEARAVILATGANRATPTVNGLAAFEGRGVSYCAVCDAFFHRGREVAVLGNGAYALHEAQTLLPIVKKVTILTNGQPPAVDFPPSLPVITTPIEALTGANTVESVCFTDGSILSLTGLFIAVGVAGSTALAQKIGAVVENGRIVTDSAMRTSVPGLWAAGDCTGGMKQIAKAVYEGAVAGTDAVRCLREQ